jgi:hypothetical protein
MIRILRLDRAITKEELTYFQKESLDGLCVFNPDNRRLQKEVSTAHPLVSSLIELLSKHGLMRGRQIGGVVVMHSLKGCRKQEWHTDYEVEPGKTRRKKAIGVLLALETPTFLETPETKYELSAGDVICFEEDVVHAGAAYSRKSNTRLHMYLDVAGAPRALDQNKTWLVKLACAPKLANRAGICKRPNPSRS